MKAKNALFNPSLIASLCDGRQTAAPPCSGSRRLDVVKIERVGQLKAALRERDRIRHIAKTQRRPRKQFLAGHGGRPSLGSGPGPHKTHHLMAASDQFKGSGPANGSGCPQKKDALPVRRSMRGWRDVGHGRRIFGKGQVGRKGGFAGRLKRLAFDPNRPPLKPLRPFCAGPDEERPQGLDETCSGQSCLGQTALIARRAAGLGKRGGRQCHL